MSYQQQSEDSVGVEILAVIFYSLFSLFRWMLVVVPFATLTLIGLFMMKIYSSDGVVGLLIPLAMFLLLGMMWWKGYRWQWNRILADRIANKIQKLYRLSGLEVRTYASVEGLGRYRVELVTPRGSTDEDILRGLSMVSSGLQAVSVTPAVDDDPHDGHVVIYVVMKDVLANVPTPADLPSMDSIKDPMLIGTTIHGLTLKLSLWQEHVLIGGMSGRGKSVLANLIIASLQDLRDNSEASVWGVDPHRTEFAPRDFDKLARSADEATDLLTELLEEGDRRLKVMEENGWKKWDTSAGPAIIVLVDELAAIFTNGDKGDKDRKRLLSRAYAELRKAGITVIGMTQTPSAQLLGDLRNNAGIRIAFGCATDDQLGQILGAHWVDSAKGVSVRAIPAPTPGRNTRGMCFIQGGEYAEPTLGRVYAPTI